MRRPRARGRSRHPAANACVAEAARLRGDQREHRERADDIGVGDGHGGGEVEVRAVMACSVLLDSPPQCAAEPVLTRAPSGRQRLRDGSDPRVTHRRHDVRTNPQPAGQYGATCGLVHAGSERSASRATDVAGRSRASRVAPRGALVRGGAPWPSPFGFAPRTATAFPRPRSHTRCARRRSRRVAVDAERRARREAQRRALELLRAPGLREQPRRRVTPVRRDGVGAAREHGAPVGADRATTCGSHGHADRQRLSGARPSSRSVGTRARQPVCRNEPSGWTRNPATASLN